MPSVGAKGGASAAGGRFTPDKPSIAYSGPLNTATHQFTISNYDATYIYTVANATQSTSTVTLSAATVTGQVSAKSPKGTTASTIAYPETKAPDTTYVPFVQCYNPCGNCNTSVNPHTWSCGCGSPCGDSGGGAWGDCICRGPGYSYWNNYGPTYTWSGSNYTNGTGEWYRVV
jgi:hypothetical protein